MVNKPRKPSEERIKIGYRSVSIEELIMDEEEHMGITVRKVDPTKEDLRYLDGPWDNSACMGYAIMAMQDAGMTHEQIESVLHHMKWRFDGHTTAEAAQYYRKEPW